MKSLAARSSEASRLRQRKYELVRQFGLPENLVGGSLRQTHRRCGKPNCHCARGPGHPMWSVTSSHHGKRRVERVPTQWVDEVTQAAMDTRTFLDALKEVISINIELLAQTRRQQQAKRRTSGRAEVPRTGAAPVTHVAEPTRVVG